jgi:crotonobetainyl-CoA:carnitine CoA-transferase CaiB-like acyl-CoA transferase
MEWAQPLEMANGHQTKTVVSPVKFNGKNAGIAKRPPRLGEHNDELVG